MMEDIWVLQCGDVPDTYHEDVFVLIQNIQRIFPDKMWHQLNPLVWYMVDGPWKAVKIMKAKTPKAEAAQS